MDIPEIMEAVKALPAWKQRAIASQVIWHIDKTASRESAKARYDTLVEKAEAVTGYTNLPNQRDGRSVVVRTLATWRMIEEGYTKSDIARCMNRDHASVIYLEGKIKAALQIPAAFQDLIGWHTKMNNLLEQRTND